MESMKNMHINVHNNVKRAKKFQIFKEEKN